MYSHLKEDFKTVLNDEQLAKMTEAELEFHYFKYISRF